MNYVTIYYRVSIDAAVQRRDTIRTDELDYHLPADRIAQHPVHPRDRSRLLVLDRASGSLTHAVFGDLGRFLRPDDCLVLNETRVLPARFNLRRETGGRIRGLFLRTVGDNRWRVLLTGGGKLRIGELLMFEGMAAQSRGHATRPGHATRRGHATRSARTARVEERAEDGQFEISIDPPAPAEQVLALVGRAPLPPYIKRSDDTTRAESLRDKMDYQTVYARSPTPAAQGVGRPSGSVAAPTAGLHFTPELLESLMAAGIRVARLTLHVGLGTFQPVTADDLSGHVTEPEWYDLPASAAREIDAARAAGGRIVAVGTTSVRVLETASDESGKLRAGSGRTHLLIYPPYRFKAVDALLTNFHLPRSTLLALVFAFAGRERILDAYQEAIAVGYRFYSFGDAMLIV